MIALEELVDDRNVCHKVSTVNGKKNKRLFGLEKTWVCEKETTWRLLGTALVVCDKRLVREPDAR